MTISTPSPITFIVLRYTRRPILILIGVYAVSMIGWTLIPLLIGAIAKRSGNLHRGFLVAAADAVILLVLVIAHLIYAGTLH